MVWWGFGPGLRHKRYRALLSEHMDGRLAPAMRARLEEHLRTCSLCRDELEGLVVTVGLLRQVPQTEAPRSFRLHAAPELLPAPRPSLPLLRPLRAASVVAALLLASLVVGDFAGLFSGVTPAQPPAATAPGSLRGLEGPATVSAVPTPTPAPDSSAAMTRLAPDGKLVTTPPAQEVGSAADAKVAVPQVAQEPAPPRSIVATILLYLKLALGTAVAALASATAYLAWRQR